MLQPPSGEAVTVLVVDDDPSVQGLITAVLASRGYHVLEARHAVHALQLCKQHPGPIHLLVTDILMPHMNGRDLAAHAVALRPEMRVLYMSGYENGILMQGFRLNDKIAFLQKPFAPTVLLQKVQDTLGSPG